MSADESASETLLAEEGFIVFPEETIDVGKVYQLPNGELYAEIAGAKMLLDERTADRESNTWYVLLEDGKPVII